MRPALAACLLPLAACTATPRAAPPPLPGTPLGADASLLPGRFVQGEQPDGNSVLLRAPAGLIVFDTGRHDGQAQAILAAARAAHAPIAAIVNSHWHLDHVSGNAPLRAAYPDAPVYASDAIDGALHGFLADYRAQLVEAMGQAPAGDAQVPAWRAEIARIDGGDRLRPTRPVRAAGVQTLAGRALQLGLERDAVSGGDVWLYDPAARLLLAGDLVTLPAPLLDTACAQGWSAALARLDALPFATLVPGHGAPLTHAQFATWRGAYDHLLACAASDAPAAACRDGWLADAGALVPESDRSLATGLLEYYVGQVLRAPEPRRSQSCTAR